MHLKSISKGLFCGIFYVSAFFWSCILALVFPTAGTLIAILSAVLTNVLTGILLTAAQYRVVLFQWLLSVPAGVATFWLYRTSNFVPFWLHRLYPDSVSNAGTGIAILLYMLFFCVCFLLAAAIAFFWSGRGYWHKITPAKTGANA